MKKLYLKPHTKLNIFNYHQTLLNETSPRGVEVGDGNTTLPGAVGERTEDDDPFHNSAGSGTGQGSGGGGNRSKAYQVWEY